MRRPGIAAIVLLIGPLLYAQESGQVQDALDILLSQQPPETAEKDWVDPCKGSHETRVYRLAPTDELSRLIETLLSDPFAMPMDHKGISVVVLARPLPCGERLLSAHVELWDSLALERRSRATRFFFRLTDWFRRRDPSMWDIVFPDGGVARKAQRGYRLTRSVEFRRGSPWMGTINGFGVVVLALASNSVSGATMTFKTEKLVSRKPGKKPRRVVSRRRGDSVALPGPDAPMADPEKIRSRLGMER